MKMMGKVSIGHCFYDEEMAPQSKHHKQVHNRHAKRRTMMKRTRSAEKIAWMREA